MILILSIYLIGYVLALYPSQQWFLENGPAKPLFGREVDKEDVMFAFFISALVSILWPFWLFVYASFKVSKFLWGGIRGRGE